MFEMGINLISMYFSEGLLDATMWLTLPMGFLGHKVCEGIALDLPLWQRSLQIQGLFKSLGKGGCPYTVSLGIYMGV